MLRFILGALVIGLIGCAAPYDASRFVGQSVQEVIIAEGPPVHVFEMDNDRTGYQWIIGGGTTVHWPGETHSLTTAYGLNGDSASASTVTSTTPGVSETLPGCPLTFIVGPDGIVENWRSPCDDRD